MDHVLGGELVQRRQPLALEPQQPVRVVLDHEDAVLAGQRHHRRRVSSDSRTPDGF